MVLFQQCPCHSLRCGCSGFSAWPQPCPSHPCLQWPAGQRPSWMCYGDCSQLSLPLSSRFPLCTCSPSLGSVLTYIIPLDEFGALLEAVGHAHGLELQGVHSGLSPSHLGSSGLRAARASAVETGHGAPGASGLGSRFSRLLPPLPADLPASWPPHLWPAPLSKRDYTRRHSSLPCPGRDAGSGARGDCRASGDKKEQSPAVRAARRLILLGRRLEAHHSAHPLCTEGARE